MFFLFGYRSESDFVMEFIIFNLFIIVNIVVDFVVICKN